MPHLLAQANESQVLSILSTLITLVIGPLVGILTIVVGFLVAWNRKQQVQLDRCEEQHKECELDNMKLKNRVEKLERIVRGAKEDDDC